jgi:hypothetical protein
MQECALGEGVAQSGEDLHLDVLHPYVLGEKLKRKLGKYGLVQGRESGQVMVGGRPLELLSTLVGVAI